MKSPIQSLVELVKDRDLRQKANKDTMSGAAPLKVPATFISCRKCGRRALHSRWEENYYICPHCGSYSPIGAYYRLKMLYDPGTFQELDQDMAVKDPLDFPEYREKAESHRQSQLTKLQTQLLR